MSVTSLRLSKKIINRKDFPGGLSNVIVKRYKISTDKREGRKLKHEIFFMLSTPNFIRWCKMNIGDVLNIQLKLNQNEIPVW